MGCTGSTESIDRKLLKFGKQAPTVCISFAGKTYVLETARYTISTLHARDVEEPRYFYYEKRFETLMQRRLKQSANQIALSSKESMVQSVLKNQELRVDVVDIIQRKGLSQNYRWSFYKAFVSFDERLQINARARDKLHQSYFATQARSMPTTEDLIRKDACRTDQTSELYARSDSLGTAILIRICKGLASYFPRADYVQGMNFIVHFISMLSGLNEMEGFSFIVHFFCKRKNIYFALYEEGFVLLKLLCRCFHAILFQRDPSLEIALKSYLPDELYLSRWILTLFCGSFEKAFLFRLWDFLLIGDMFSPVLACIEIVSQLRDILLESDLPKTAALLGSRSELCKALDFTRFIKNLKFAYKSFPALLLITTVDDYWAELSPDQQSSFEHYYHAIRMRLEPQKTPEEDFHFFKEFDL